MFLVVEDDGFIVASLDDKDVAHEVGSGYKHDYGFNIMVIPEQEYEKWCYNRKIKPNPTKINNSGLPQVMPVIEIWGSQWLAQMSHHTRCCFGETINEAISNFEKKYECEVVFNKTLMPRDLTVDQYVEWLIDNNIAERVNEQI